MREVALINRVRDAPGYVSLLMTRACGTGFVMPASASHRKQRTNGNREGSVIKNKLVKRRNQGKRSTGAGNMTWKDGAGRNSFLAM